jgi:hypothetical protein
MNATATTPEAGSRIDQIKIVSRVLMGIFYEKF